MTDNSSITNHMIRRIWWAQTWRSYALAVLFSGTTIGIAYLGEFYTVTCIKNYCHYSLTIWLDLLCQLIVFIAIPLATHWIALNRTYPQITIGGTHFTTSILLKKGDAFANKARAILTFFWSFNWRYVPIVMMVSICLMVLLNYYKNLFGVFGLFLFFTLILLVVYHASMQILDIVLSKKFKTFEIGVTPHASESNQEA